MKQNVEKLIFFDIGGTLCGAPHMFEYISQKFSPSNRDEVVEIMGKFFNDLYSNKNEDEFITVREMLELCLKQIAIELETEDLSSKAYAYYKELYIDNSFLYEDTIEVLNKIREKGISLIALSDADSEVLIENLKVLNIRNFFDKLIISSDVKSYKPSNKIISEALNCCNIPKSKIFIVGDSKVDIDSGKKMGINTVLINRTAEERDYGSDYTIKSLRELLQII